MQDSNFLLNFGVLSLAIAGLLAAVTGSLIHHQSPLPQQPWKFVQDYYSPLPSPPPSAHKELKIFLEKLFQKIR